MSRTRYQERGALFFGMGVGSLGGGIFASIGMGTAKPLIYAGSSVAACVLLAGRDEVRRRRDEASRTR